MVEVRSGEGLGITLWRKSNPHFASVPPFNSSAVAHLASKLPCIAREAMSFGGGTPKFFRMKSMFGEVRENTKRFADPSMTRLARPTASLVASAMGASTNFVGNGRGMTLIDISGVSGACILNGMFEVDHRSMAETPLSAKRNSWLPIRRSTVTIAPSIRSESSVNIASIPSKDVLLCSASPKLIFELVADSLRK